MSQQSLIYSFVARGTVILVEFTDFKVVSVGRQIPMAFLDRVKEDFTKRYGGGTAETAQANSLNKEFGLKLKEHMQYCMDHSDEVIRLAKVKAQVSQAAMKEIIEKVLERGVICKLLGDKPENLRPQAFIINRTQMRRKMWFQSMKIKPIVLGIFIALILIIIVCGGIKLWQISLEHFFIHRSLGSFQDSRKLPHPIRCE